MSTHNLCMIVFLSVNFQFLEVKFSIYLCPGYDVKLHPAVTLNMSVGM